MPSRGVSRCRTTVTGTEGAVGRRQVEAGGDVALAVVPGRLLAHDVGDAPDREVDVGPHRRLDVRLVDDGDGGWRRTPCCGRSAPRLRRSDCGDAVPAPARSSSGSTRSDVGGVGAQAQHDVPGEGVDPLEPLGRVLGTYLGPRRVVLVAVARDRGAETSRNSTASSLVTRSSSVALADVLGAVDDPRAAPAHRARGRLGVVGVDHPDLAGVTALAQHQDDRPAASCRAGGGRSVRRAPRAPARRRRPRVPIRCRQTWWGR